jgi:hypothetical protein
MGPRLQYDIALKKLRNLAKTGTFQVFCIVIAINTMQGIYIDDIVRLKM